MANFLAVIDHDSERRSLFIRNIRAHIAPLADLAIDERHHGELSTVWATSPHAPISIAQDNTGLSIIFGEAIQPESSHRTKATELKTAWQTSPGQPYDGYYAALTYEPITGLKVGADILGCFPIYYFLHPEVVLVGSSPELFRYHPNFSPKLDLEGLVGLLLTCQLANNQSLWQGVKRLGVGNLLVCNARQGSEELLQYRPPCFQADIQASAYEKFRAISFL